MQWRLLLPLFVLLSAYLYRDHFKLYYYVDDAYIYLQVIRNLISFNGWLYNAGDIVNPCSSVSYTLFLLIISLPLHLLGQAGLPLSIDMAPAIAQVISAALIATVTIKALDTMPLYSRLAFALCLAYHPLLFRTAGMESAFLIASFCVAAALYCRQYYFLAGLALAVAGLARLEGYALIGFIVLIQVLRYRRLDPMLVSGFLLPSIVWYAFSYVYFGGLFSHTTYAKLAQSHFAVEMFGRGGLTILKAYLWQPRYLPITVFLVLMGFLKLYQCFRRGEYYLPLLALVGFSQLIAYRILDGMPYFWYLVPVDIATNIAVLCGLIFIIEQMQRWLLRRELRFKPIAFVDKTPVKMLGAVSLALLLTLIVDNFGIVKKPQSWPYRGARTYYAIGNWLNKNTSEDVTVAVMEVGYIGYFAQRRMIDKMGLLHKNAIKHLNEKQLDWWYQEKPEWIVKHESNVLDNWFSDETRKDFQAHYVLRHQISKGQIWERQTARQADAKVSADD